MDLGAILISAIEAISCKKKLLPFAPLVRLPLVYLSLPLFQKCENFARWTKVIHPILTILSKKSSPRWA